MARRRYSRPRFSRTRYLRKGKVFRRGGKLVRYVYRGSKRIGLEIVRSYFKKAWKEDLDRLIHRN
jgi:hypothetical protein